MNTELKKSLEEREKIRQIAFNKFAKLTKEEQYKKVCEGYDRLNALVIEFSSEIGFFPADFVFGYLSSAVRGLDRKTEEGRETLKYFAQQVNSLSEAIIGLEDKPK